MQPAIAIFDFDGTITEENPAEKVLEVFADKEWRKYDDEWEAGRLSLEETLKIQYSTIIGDYEKILETARKVPVRKGFKELIQYLKSKNIEVQCVSAGIRFIIEDFFGTMGLEIPLITAKSEYNRETRRIDVELLTFDEVNYRDFKEEIVDGHKNSGKSIIYFGDGSSDKHGIELADLRFVVKNSSLERKCIANSLQFHSFIDFTSVPAQIEEFIVNFS